MRSYWVIDIIRQNHLHIFWEEEKKTLSEYVKKHNLIWHHRAFRPIYVKATKKDKKNQKTGKLGSGDGVPELPILGEPKNWINPLRKSGIQFHRTWKVPLRESGI